MVVKSYIEKLKWDEETASKRYDNDEKSLDLQLKNRIHYRIDFANYVSEEQILNFFQDTEITRYAA